MAREKNSSPRHVFVVLILSATAFACRSEQKDTAAAQSSSSVPLVLAPSGSSEGPMAPPIPNAESVIANLRPQFRLCYRAGLMTDPGMQGGVVMDARVSPEGTVTAVTEHAPSTLSPAVVGCLEEVLKAATFSPPGGTGSSVRVPINFRSAADGGL